MILVPRRGPAGGQDRVGHLCAAVQCIAHGAPVIRDASHIDRHMAEPVQKADQHGPVGVIYLTRSGVVPGLDQFVTGRDHRHPQSFADRDLGHARRREQRDVAGAQHAAGGEDRGSGGHVLACPARVGPGPDACAKGDGVAALGHVLLKDHRIDTPGQRGPGEDAQRLALWHGAPEGHARRGAARDQRQHRIARRQGGMGKPVAVHGGIGAGRVGAARRDRCCEDAAQGLSGGPRFGPGHRGQPGFEQGQSLVHRRPVDPGGQGKAIVAQGRRSKRGRKYLGQQVLVAEAENPALLGRVHLKQPVERGRIQPRQKPRHGLHLHRVARQVRARFGPGHRLAQERGPDFHEGNGGIQRLERPDADPACKARAQPVQDGKPHEHLRADRARTCELPAGKAAPGAGFDNATVRERVGIAGLGARQAVVIGPGSIGPERAFARAQIPVDPCRDLETVVGFRAVLDVSREPVPDGERIIRPGQRGGEALWVGEGHVETDHQAAACGGLGLDQLGQRLFEQGPVAEIDRPRLDPVADQPHPDRILARGRAGIVAARAIDHGKAVKPAHSPTSDRMKLAMASVSSRSKTGMARSSGLSLATARMLGSPGAISALPVSARKASILGCDSDL